MGTGHLQQSSISNCTECLSWCWLLNDVTISNDCGVNDWWVMIRWDHHYTHKPRKYFIINWENISCLHHTQHRVMVSPLVRCITVFRPGLEWAPLSDRLVVSSWVLFTVSTHRVIITSRVWLSIRCWRGKYQRLNLLQDLLERCCIEKYFSQ